MAPRGFFTRRKYRTSSHATHGAGQLQRARTQYENPTKTNKMRVYTHGNNRQMVRRLYSSAYIRAQSLLAGRGPSLRFWDKATSVDFEEPPGPDNRGENQYEYLRLTKMRQNVSALHPPSPHKNEGNFVRLPPSAWSNRSCNSPRGTPFRVN